MANNYDVKLSILQSPISTLYNQVNVNVNGPNNSYSFSNVQLAESCVSNLTPQTSFSQMLYAGDIMLHNLVQ